jgi:hypothetical protein
MGSWLYEVDALVRSDKGKSRRLPDFGQKPRPRPARASQRHSSDRRSPHPDQPAELYRAGRMWKYGGPIRRSQPNERRRGDS